MVDDKITPGTPDSVCLQCSQCYEGECRAFEVPHSEEERNARSGIYGMECDPPRHKKFEHERYGTLYHTPPGKYE